MRKLIDTYRKAPTEKNRQRLLAYAGKHPFAMILLTIEDQQFLNSLI
jgi:hypothetical protein